MSLGLPFLLKDSTIGNLSAWVLTLSCFAYPVTAVIIALVGVPSTPVNIALKAFYLFLSIILLALGLLKKNNRFSIATYSLICFWFIYSCRLVYDISFRHIKIAIQAGDRHMIEDTAALIYPYFFGVILIPGIAIGLTAKYINVKKLLNIMFIILVIANIEILLFLFTNNSQHDYMDVFAQRANIESSINGENKVVLNTILLGYFGQVLAIFSTARLLFFRQRNIMEKIFLSVCLVASFVVMVAAASRSPFLSYFLILLILLFRHFWITRKTLAYFTKLLLSVSIVIYLVIGYALPAIQDSKFALVERLTNFYEERAKGKSEYRDQAFATAWSDFLDSPALGKQFVSTFDNFYPHSIPLEILMTVGVLGLTPFTISLFYFLKKYIRFLRSKHQHFFLLVIIITPAISLGLVSGSLYSSADFWLFLSALISINNPYSCSLIQFNTANCRAANSLLPSNY